VPSARLTFFPSLLAALIAAPVLTAGGTYVALHVGALVGGPAFFDLMPTEDYWNEVQSSVFERREAAHILKWAPLVNAYRSVGFMLSTMLISQACARWRRRAQPRHVPLIITTAVVLSCLAVLLLDWGFSQMYVRLDDTHLAVGPSDPSDIYRDPAGGGGDGAAASEMGAPSASEGFADADEQADYAAYYAGGGVGSADATYADADDDEDQDGDHEEL
jgi:hypothetical protein